MELAREDKYPLPLDGETVWIPCYIGGLVITSSINQTTGEAPSQERKNSEKTHGSLYLPNNMDNCIFIPKWPYKFQSSFLKPRAS